MSSNKPELIFFHPLVITGRKCSEKSFGFFPPSFFLTGSQILKCLVKAIDKTSSEQDSSISSNFFQRSVMHLHLQERYGSSPLSRLCMGSLHVDAVSLLSCVKIDIKYYLSFLQVLLFSLAVPMPPSLGGIYERRVKKYRNLIWLRKLISC